ncbi:permease [Streptomyces sp. NPDC005077]|uniref:permease n=1 Tax=Streptomyces sp. NPDC005077 TaxID=3154292 RepID=UPI0033A88B5E
MVRYIEHLRDERRRRLSVIDRPATLLAGGHQPRLAMVFEIASASLIVELGIILALLMGCQFTAAEFLGCLTVIVVLAALFRLYLRDKLVRQAREQAEQTYRLNGGPHPAGMCVKVPSPAACYHARASCSARWAATPAPATTSTGTPTPRLIGRGTVLRDGTTRDTPANADGRRTLHLGVQSGFPPPGRSLRSPAGAVLAP